MTLKKIGFAGFFGLGGLLLAWLLRPFPSAETIDAFEHRFVELDDDERQGELEAFLRRLGDDDNADELDRAIGFDQFIVVRYGLTRDSRIIAAYAHSRDRSIGTAAYRMCSAFEQFWAIDAYGRTLAESPEGARYLEACKQGGAWVTRSGSRPMPASATVSKTAWASSPAPLDLSAACA